MYPLRPDVSFIQSLCHFDHDLFLAAKAKGCPHCGAPLDTANYNRKTRGMREDQEIRYSLCCRREGCRKRLTPRSVRFLGRKVYGAWVVILAVEYCSELGLKGQIARQTIARWRFFWKERLSQNNSFMQWARSLLPPGAIVSDNPVSILCHFGFPERKSWLFILKFFTQTI